MYNWPPQWYVSLGHVDFSSLSSTIQSNLLLGTRPCKMTSRSKSGTDSLTCEFEVASGAMTCGTNQMCYRVPRLIIYHHLYFGCVCVWYGISTSKIIEYSQSNHRKFHKFYHEKKSINTLTILHICRCDRLLILSENLILITVY